MTPSSRRFRKVSEPDRLVRLQRDRPRHRHGAADDEPVHVAVGHDRFIGLEQRQYQEMLAKRLSIEAADGVRMRRVPDGHLHCRCLMGK